jgi:hypothetical protein
MQFSTLTSTVLLLATSISAAPAPQAQTASAPVDKSTFVIADGKLGVALWEANGEGDGFTMNHHAISRGDRDMVNVHTGVTYATLEVVVGNSFNPATIRCAVLDHSGREVFGRRGANFDTTFADGNNGRWTLERPSRISQIICDPRFRANNRG